MSASSEITSDAIALVWAIEIREINRVQPVINDVQKRPEIETKNGAQKLELDEVGRSGAIAVSYPTDGIIERFFDNAKTHSFCLAESDWAGNCWKTLGFDRS